jgi:tetratricopeptide (TPR) repeat protein
MRRSGQGRSRAGSVVGRAAACVLVFAVTLGAPHGDADAGDAATLRTAREASAAGKHQEAWDVVLAGLASAPGDLDLLAVGADAATALGRKDEALWLASAARLAAIGASQRQRLPEFETRIEALDPLAKEERAPVDAYAKALLETARTCVRKKLWVNAVQILARLEGSVVGPEAEAELEKIYANKAALAALLDSEVEVPETQTDRKILARAAKEDPKHTDWSAAWKVDSPSYSVLTNGGWVLANRTSAAMEQINRHYRTVFRTGIKDKAATPRCTVRIYRQRAEYDAIGKAPKDSLGYYQPGENSVNAYDPRSAGAPLASLWPTLFHEASHQFTEMISKTDVPSWLNEGTACTFEGSRLRPDGKVETTQIPEGRLADAAGAVRDANPTIRQVLEYGEPGSYPAEYYGTGWALVHFLRAWENEKFERPYLAVYDALVDSYRAGQPGRSMERFVKFVVDGAKQPGIADYDAWEERFRDWLSEMSDMHLGPPSTAKLFVERARKKRAAGKPALAEEDYRFALRRMPGHVDALLELSELLQARNRKDEAISLVRRVVEALRKDGVFAAGFDALDRDAASAAAVKARAQLGKLDADFAAAFDLVDRSLAAQAQKAAEAYVAKGFPRAALTLLDAASPLLEGDEEMDLLRSRIAEEAKCDVLLPRRVAAEAGLAGWYATPEFQAAGGTVKGKIQGAARAALFEAALPSRYTFEATVRPVRGGDEALVGLLFGCDPGGQWNVVGTNGGDVEIWKILEFPDRIAAPGTLDPGQRKQFRLTVEVRPGLARVLVDGKLFADQEYPRSALRGGIGLYVNDAEAEFADLRLSVPTGRYFRD